HLLCRRRHPGARISHVLAHLPTARFRSARPVGRAVSALSLRAHVRARFLERPRRRDCAQLEFAELRHAVSESAVLAGAASHRAYRRVGYSAFDPARLSAGLFPFFSRRPPPRTTFPTGHPPPPPPLPSSP